MVRLLNGSSMTELKVITPRCSLTIVRLRTQARCQLLRLQPMFLLLLLRF